MIKMRGMLRVLIAALLVVSLIAAGCAALQKPAPENPPERLPGPAAPQEPMPEDQQEVNRIAGELAEVAANVPGVNDAAVVIAGTTVYVAIDQEAGAENDDTEKIKNQVSEEVRKAEPRLRDIYVSSDPDIMQRLQRIASGVNEGRPISAFDRELAEITKRIDPISQ